MERLRNIVVFGDSLSDIGSYNTAWGNLLGGAGLITTSPTGRFSDCRNWTDHMYEEASNGKSLITNNAATSIKLSSNHRTLSQSSSVVLTDQSKDFLYVNYAQGGATGMEQRSVQQMVLETFEGEIKSFEKQWNYMFYGKKLKEEDKKTLVFVWFGANDLHTCGCAPVAMSDVANAIAKNGRERVLNIIGKDFCKFVFMNLPGPDKSPRTASLGKSKAKGDLEHFNKLSLGTNIFNRNLKYLAEKEQDLYIDIDSSLNPIEFEKAVLAISHVGSYYDTLKCQPEKVTHFIDARFYEPDDDDDDASPLIKPIFTCDRAHPSDFGYKYCWNTIKTGLSSADYSFGSFRA